MTRLQGPESGQEERLTEMIRLYEKDILRLCYLYLHDVDLAKDAAQDTFLKAYTHLDSQQDPEKEKSWLVTIAMNVCRDYLRSAWIRHMNRSVQIEDLPVSASPPEENRLTLTAAIMNLPPKYSEVSLLSGITFRLQSDKIGRHHHRMAPGLILFKSLFIDARVNQQIEL